VSKKTIGQVSPGGRQPIRWTVAGIAGTPDENTKAAFKQAGKSQQGVSMEEEQAWVDEDGDGGSIQKEKEHQAREEARQKALEEKGRRKSKNQKRGKGRSSGK
jgi:hypothetical protein